MRRTNSKSRTWYDGTDTDGSRFPRIRRRAFKTIPFATSRRLHSQNNGNNGTPTAFDGLLRTGRNAGNNAYVNVLATGVAGTGTALAFRGRTPPALAALRFEKAPSAPNQHLIGRHRGSVRGSPAGSPL
jgi:hypothetical protein